MIKNAINLGREDQSKVFIYSQDSPESEVFLY